MAVDYFFKIDGIQGESMDSNHKNEIQLLSWSWGGDQTSSSIGGGSGAGKVHMADLHVVKTVDKATVPLLKALTKGSHIGTGVLTACKASGDSGGKPFMTMTLSELFVTSLQSSGASEVPSESVSFSYAKVKVEYSMQGEGGTLTSAGNVTYDLKANTVS